jgi:SAM-dependent methyltransferase
MVDHSNLADYADPVIYDLENNHFEPDGPFFLTLARQLGGPVLELGCGTGRITIPLAQHSLDITGLDIAPAMLAQARRKADDLPVQWVEGDVRDFSLDRQFCFIFTSGCTFQHLLERADQEAMLARVHEHLVADGRFVVEAIFPHPRLLATVEEEQEWFSYEDGQGRTIRVSGTEHYDHVRQIKHETAYRRWYNADREEMIRPAPLALRYIFPQEMEALLHYNGFTVEDCYGDWDHGRLTEKSVTMVYVCQKRS